MLLLKCALVLGHVFTQLGEVCCTGGIMSQDNLACSPGTSTLLDCKLFKIIWIY